jgi:hypothetical protein
MIRTTVSLIALAAGLALAGPAAAQRIEASVHCEPTDEELLYVCHFDMTQNGKALPGAVFTITPSMPSMPMAHNIAPVPAQDLCTEGRGYHAYLKLDMHGDWALTLDVTAPRRDRIVINHSFLPASGEAPTQVQGMHKH